MKYLNKNLHIFKKNVRKMAFSAKISHLNPDPGEKINFTRQKILKLYQYLYPVQVPSFLGPGPGIGRKGLRYKENVFNVQSEK
jgi:hypothetical protein